MWAIWVTDDVDFIEVVLETHCFLCRYILAVLFIIMKGGDWVMEVDVERCLWF